MRVDIRADWSWRWSASDVTLAAIAPLFSPGGWNRLRSVVGAGVSVDRVGRVGVVTEVHGDQGVLAEAIGAVEGPQGRIERVDYVAEVPPSGLG